MLNEFPKHSSWRNTRSNKRSLYSLEMLIHLLQIRTLDFLLKQMGKVPWFFQMVLFNFKMTSHPRIAKDLNTVLLTLTPQLTINIYLSWSLLILTCMKWNRCTTPLKFRRFKLHCIQKVFKIVELPIQKKILPIYSSFLN